jgi:hypothetical protein
MTIVSYRRTGVPPVSDSNALFGHPCGLMTVPDACLPCRSRPKAGVFECVWQTKRNAGISGRRPSVDRRPYHRNRTTASPSPGGEGWGEGGLNTDILGRAHASRVPYWASRRIPLMPLRSKPTTLRTASSLLKASKGYSSPFLRILFYFHPLAKVGSIFVLSTWDFSRFVGRRHFLPAYASLRQVMPTYASTPPGGGLPCRSVMEGAPSSSCATFGGAMSALGKRRQGFHQHEGFPEGCPLPFVPTLPLDIMHADVKLTAYGVATYQ